jgi:hypothetical protein
MIVVSDASPLAALSYIRKIELLPQLFGQVLAPDAVWQELLAGRQHPGREAVIQATWIERRTVQNHQLVLALQKDLDRGEAEAIALALETDADLLIIDERLGRRTAQHFGLNIIGVVGVLIDAKHHGLIAEVRPYLDQLRIIAGFRISDALFRRVLADEQESTQENG